MELYTQEVLKIFARNFKFPIVETRLGPAVKMDAINAFLFANITGAGYLDDPMFLFSPKGTQKILREAFKYNFVAGIYNKGEFFYSPLELLKKRPYIFNGYKYIIFKEVIDECELTEELQDIYDDLICSGEKPTDYLIFRIEANKNGNGMEPFLEYLTCQYFKSRGYIVENQVPLAATVGSPDFGGYKMKDGAIGLHINELALIRITKNYEILNDLTIYGCIVGEAKTSTKIMENQLRKYMDTTLFSEGFEIHPSKSKPSIDSFGLLNLNEDYSICCKKPNSPYPTRKPETYNLSEYKVWLNNYFKLFLLSNFYSEEIKCIIKKTIGKNDITNENILDVIFNLTVNEIIDLLKEVM